MIFYRLRAWFARFLARFQPASVESLVLEANQKYGEVTFTQTMLPDGYGWTCSIRSSKPPRYSWVSTGVTMGQSLRLVMQQASDAPIKPIVGTPCRPLLGTREFDDE